MWPPASPSCRLYEPEAVGAIGAYASEGSGNAECGLRPVGGIGVYAPEGSGNVE
jgi:hypothetical protein